MTALLAAGYAQIGSSYPETGCYVRYRPAPYPRPFNLSH
jgi:hypothetical protein